MVKDISIIGGDLRIVKLVNMLKDNYNVRTYALEESTEIENINNSVEECIENTDVIISAIPFSKDGIKINTPYSKKQIQIEELFSQANGKTIIAGNLTNQIKELAINKNVQIIDILEQEELAILNAISTAEGAIQIAISNIPKNLCGSNVLIMGFGRIGKILAKMLDGIGANVSCEARKKSDLAWIKSYGYEPIDINNLKNNLARFDIIFNTIPSIILDKEKLEQIKEETLIIDLASAPGGVDKNQVEILNKKYILALALPGKISPKSSAEYIKQTLENMFISM